MWVEDGYTSDIFNRFGRKWLHFPTGIVLDRYL